MTVSINRRFMLVGLGGISSTLTGCDLMNTTRNYQLTFELTIDGRKHVDSVVQQLRTRPYNRHIAGDTSYTEAFGEGAVIDLGERGKLFSIMRFPAFNKISGHLTYDYSSRMLVELGLADGGGKVATFLGSQNLPFEHAPGLVAFTNLNDPTSVVAISPDKLGAYFGPNVSLDKILVGFTFSPMTKGKIEKSLPWLRGKQSETNLDGSLGQSFSPPYSLAREIVFTDFKREN